MGFIQKRTKQQTDQTVPVAQNVIEFQTILDSNSNATEDQEIAATKSALYRSILNKLNERKARYTKPVEPPATSDNPAHPSHSAHSTKSATIDAPPTAQNTQKRPVGRPPVVSLTCDRSTVLPRYERHVDPNVDPITAIDDLTAYLSNLTASDPRTAADFLYSWFLTSGEHFLKLFLHEIAGDPDTRALATKTGLDYQSIYRITRQSGNISPRIIAGILAAYGYGIELRILPLATIARNYIALEQGTTDFTGN